VIPPEKPLILFILSETTQPGQYRPGKATTISDLNSARGTMVLYCAPGVLDTDVFALSTFPNIKPYDIFGGWMLSWSAACVSALVVDRLHHNKGPPIHLYAYALLLTCTLVFKDVFCPALTRFWLAHVSPLAASIFTLPSKEHSFGSRGALRIWAF
jgi:hypothetical protein